MAIEQDLFIKTIHPEDGITVRFTREFNSWERLRNQLDELTNWVPRPQLSEVAFIASDIADMFDADPLQKGMLAYITREDSSGKLREVEIQYLPLGPTRTTEDQIKMGLAPKNPNPESIEICLEANPFLAKAILARKLPSSNPRG